jgi:hypothetical protein
MVNFMKKNHLWHSLIALSLIGVFNIAETAYAQLVCLGVNMPAVIPQEPFLRKPSETA